jgi:hypothetical protein
MQRTRKNIPKITPNFVPLYAVRREETCKFPHLVGKKGYLSRNMLKPQGMTLYSPDFPEARYPPLESPL